MAYISFQPSDHFNTKLYSGTGSSNAITGVGFQPDWVWIKNRSGVASHALMDAVRGNNKSLRSNTTGAEYTNTYFTSFDSDGFTLTSSETDVNASSTNYASWNWLANGSGSANTDGSISSTVSANTTAGFSIVKWTGTGANATIGHGLGSVPKFIITKRYSTTGDWVTYSEALGNGKYIILNSTDAEATGSTFWNSTTPTSSVFSVGTANGTNQSGQTFIGYCFAEKKGFSKFGSYTGNGSTDGAFIYTGFRPAFFMWKASSTTGGWYTIDNKRSDYNPSDKLLGANDSAAESAFGYNYDHDFLSNGIKTRYGSFDMNQSGVTYIYMAFAEHPLVSSNDIPAVAR